MSFFNQKDYMDKSRGGEEMHLKDTAPLISRPSSPERKFPTRLADIPEATPGPNAFAQEAARLERHRLESNAFYQQEVQKHKVTPLTSTHPALRQRSNSDPPTPPRLSSCTTMSPFVNAGKENDHSPPLKLVPDKSANAQPTQRAYIEETREQILHERSKSKEERIPVFVPTPKVGCHDFAKSSESTAAANKQKETGLVPQPTKTPKRYFMEKLRLTTNLLGISSPATAAQEPAQKDEDEQKVPPKAKAVLGASPPKVKGRPSFGTSPSKSALPRSPSKRRAFFSRKNSELPSIDAPQAAPLTSRSADYEQAPLSASTVIQAPPTAFSDPTHYSYQGKRYVSQSHSDQGKAAEKDKEASKCAVARSQSLKYFDHAVPPTPPAKNTPPDEKARKEAASKMESSRVPFHDNETTPSRSPTGIVSINGRISPTKYGGYGHRETATIVTRPSMYSLHASVVPNLTEASTFEEMKARVDALGLEGFSMPGENTRSPNPALAYTPSIYSAQFSPRPNSAFAKVSPATPQGPSHSHNPSTHTKSSSSNGEISVFYPGLAKDPSVSTMTTPSNGGTGVARAVGLHRHNLSDAQVPWHGYTHSRDHSQSPRHSVDSLLFARHVDDDLNDTCFDSPTSFSHISATPSPLHFLPATTYTPPPPLKSSKRAVKSKQSTEITEVKKSNSTNALGINTPVRGKSASPPRGKLLFPGSSNPIFHDVSLIPGQVSITTSRSGSRQDSAWGTSDSSVDVDPVKVSPAKSSSGEKVDRMMAMLDQLRARNGELNTMREEMRVSNARLDERLSAVEGSQRGGSPMPPSTDVVDEWGMRGRGEAQRISTNIAHDFYRLGPTQDDREDDANVEGDIENESNTIEKLMETNKRLLEMCGNMANRVKALEDSANRNA